MSLLMPIGNLVIAKRWRAALLLTMLFLSAGGEGVWGDIPMIPNTVEKIPDAELQSLIAWIRNL